MNYPIVQGDDNDYYLKRLLDGSWNSAGTIFADCRNSYDFSDFNTIVYGHNMKNKSMFGTLKKYTKQDYYNEHPFWYLTTLDKKYKVELVAGYVTPNNSNIYALEKTKEERDRLLAESIKNSIFTSNIKVNENDRLISFSTCSYEYKNARFVLLGVLRELE